MSLTLKNSVYRWLFLAALLILWSPVNAHAVSWNATTQEFGWNDDGTMTPYGLSETDDYGTMVYTMYPYYGYDTNKPKSADFTDVRDAIDYAASPFSCNVPNAWSNVSTADKAGIGVSGAPVSSRHVNALRQGVRNLYTAKGQPVPDSIQSDLNPGDPIQRSDVLDMRSSLSSLVRNHCTPAPVVCGNGIVEVGEQCDGGFFGNGACPSTCSATCSANLSCPPAPYCGDQICSGWDFFLCPSDCTVNS